MRRDYNSAIRSAEQFALLTAARPQWMPMELPFEHGAVRFFAADQP
jgi:hypothetical protein